MAPPRVMEYVQSVFAKSSVSVQVMEGHDIFEKEYPLMAAVNRAARCKRCDLISNLLLCIV